MKGRKKSATDYTLKDTPRTKQLVELVQLAPTISYEVAYRRFVELASELEREIQVLEGSRRMAAD